MVLLENFDDDPAESKSTALLDLHTEIASQYICIIASAQYMVFKMAKSRTIMEGANINHQVTSDRTSMM